MHIRPYRPADLSAIATIMADNNHTDSLARFVTRDIDKYPRTYRKGCLRSLKGMLLGKGTVCFVAETDASDYDADTKVGISANTNNDISTGTDEHHTQPASNRSSLHAPELVAYAIWTRTGTSPSALDWQRKYNGRPAAMLNRALTALETHYHKTPPFTLIEHTFHHAHYNAVRPLLRKPWDKSVFSEAWELKGLYTHASFQRRGIGTSLMNWGKERATEENVPIIVAGSPVGGIAYEKAGFESIGEIGLGREGGFDELVYGGEAMRRWCWEPSGEGRWVERARAREKLDAAEMQMKEEDEEMKTKKMEVGLGS